MDIEGEIKIGSEIKNKITYESWDMDAQIIASSDSPIDMDSSYFGAEQGDSNNQFMTDTDVGLNGIGEFELPIPVPAQNPMNHGLEEADVDAKQRAQEGTKQKEEENVQKKSKEELSKI